jgi:hypothetical protein
MDVIMGTANDLHLELIHKHEDGSIGASLLSRRQRSQPIAPIYMYGSSPTHSLLDFNNPGCPYHSIFLKLVVRHPDEFAYSLTRRCPGGANDDYLDGSPSILWISAR